MNWVFAGWRVCGYVKFLLICSFGFGDDLGLSRDGKVDKFSVLFKLSDFVEFV